MDIDGSSEFNEIHIATGFDNNYIVHIYAMITSLLHNNKGNNIVFHANTTGITDTEKKELADYIQSNNSKIIFYDIEDSLNKAKIQIPADSYFTVATFYRLFFAALIPSGVKKLLYIDPDTVIIGDLKELYQTDMGNYPVAAAPDPFFEKREELGITEKEQYFNAGVMLIDVENWKAQHVTENVLQFVKMNPEKVPYLDQDGLNATLINHWYKLDKKYNFTTADVKLQVPAKELIKDKVIIHFTSSRKPWNFLTRNKLGYLYHYYLGKSPKRNAGKYTDAKWNIKNGYTFLRIKLKEFYFNNEIDRIIPIKKWIHSNELYY